MKLKRLSFEAEATTDHFWKTGELNCVEGTGRHKVVDFLNVNLCSNPDSLSFIGR